MAIHEGPLSTAETLIYSAICVALVAISGLAAGLTLGLMSLDLVDLEVLQRSGTAKQKKYAARIAPLLQRPHLLLCSLLLMNAAAFEALPIFLDTLVTPVLAIVISVTAILIFGEILPQAVCKAYGLAIGYHCYWFVKVLMVLAFVIAWPLSKMLDWLLGNQHSALFRRAELRALVDVHGTEDGMHGAYLSPDETAVITGALDLTHKTAEAGMTPLDKVTMISADAKLNEATLRPLLALGHSRIPVHAPGRREDILGLLLVKELVLVDKDAGLTVSSLKLRRLPALPATTPMYDMLKVFQTGRSHMVVLTGAPSQHPTGFVMPAAANGGSEAAPVVTQMTTTTAVTQTTTTLEVPNGKVPLINYTTKPKLDALGTVVQSTQTAPVGDTVIDIDQQAPRHGGLPKLASSGNTLPRTASPADDLLRVPATNGIPHVPSTGSNMLAPDPPTASMAEFALEASCHPHKLPAGAPVGIITIEDVIEELIQKEIVDETDQFVDNERSQAVNAQTLLRALPPRLRVAIQGRRNSSQARYNASQLGDPAARAGQAMPLLAPVPPSPDTATAAAGAAPGSAITPAAPEVAMSLVGSSKP